MLLQTAYAVNIACLLPFAPAVFCSFHRAPPQRFEGEYLGSVVLGPGMEATATKVEAVVAAETLLTGKGKE